MLICQEIVSLKVLHALNSVTCMQIIQLYEMIIVRHGLMLVGSPFSGKSVSLKLLAGALTDLSAEGKQGALFEKVETRVINPKSVTMGQLYGEVDKATQEWKVTTQLITPYIYCLFANVHPSMHVDLQSRGYSMQVVDSSCISAALQSLAVSQIHHRMLSGRCHVHHACQVSDSGHQVALMHTIVHSTLNNCRIDIPLTCLGCA